MEQENLNSQEKLILDARKSVSLTGVETVDGFNEQMLKLTINGSKMQILGENIKINSFNKTSGNLCAQGDFFEIKYFHKKQPIMKRIFK